MKKELFKFFGVAFVAVCVLFMLSSPVLAQEEPIPDPEPTGEATSIDAEGVVTEWVAEGTLTPSESNPNFVYGTLTFTTGEGETATACEVAFSGFLATTDAGSLLKGTIGDAASNGETDPPPETQAEGGCGIYGIVDAVAIGDFVQGLARDTEGNQTIAFKLPIGGGEEPEPEPEPEPPAPPE